MAFVAEYLATPRGQAKWRICVANIIAGKKKMHSEGYVLIFCPMHPSAKKGHVYEHRLVMERHLDRLLCTDEKVHHINEDKADNRLENLEVLTHREHLQHHFNCHVTDREVAMLIRQGRGWAWLREHRIWEHRQAYVRKMMREGVL